MLAPIHHLLTNHERYDETLETVKSEPAQGQARPGNGLRRDDPTPDAGRIQCTEPERHVAI